MRVRVGVAMVTKTKIRRFFAAIHDSAVSIRNAIFGFVLTFFEKVNRKVRSTLPLWRMQEETSEHVKMLAKVFKYVILPASLFYVCSDFVFLRENAVDSMFWGILLFLYSNFLPDLPSAFRRGPKNKDLPWYKKYFLLLFAPLFVWALLCGMRIKWSTVETFHNFKSVTIFGIFLFAVGFFAFGDFPIDVGDMTESISLALYGLAGYLAHLKVDKIW